MSSVLPNPKATGLLIIDLQERLAAVMPEIHFQAVLKGHTVLLEMATLFRLPVAYTEQYPKGLGPTVQPLRDWLGSAQRVEKIEFSACQSTAFREEILPRLPHDVILTGMEAHVCVLQTAVDLLAAGHRVFVPLDAVASRTHANLANGLALMERAGAVIVNVETLVFHHLGRAGSEAFKRLSVLVK